MKTQFARIFLLTSCLGGCAAAPPLRGNVSAIAAPLPVMLGPVRCIGTCAPEPSVKHPYGKDLVVEMTSRFVSVNTARAGDVETTTTSTTVAENSNTVFAAPLLAPLLKLPFSKRSVVQLTALDLGRSVDSMGGGTDHRSSMTKLLAIGIGYSYLVPAAIPSPPPVSTTEPPAPLKTKATP